MTCEVSWLDDAVKWSKVVTPFLLIGLGFVLNRSVQKHGQNLKLTSEYNTKWSDEFISKCVNFNNSVSSIQFDIFELANAQTGKQADDIKDNIELRIKDISRAKYEIEVNSKLVDETSGIMETIEAIFKSAAKNIDAIKQNGVVSVDFGTIKDSQTKLNRQLKEMQKSVLKL